MAANYIRDQRNKIMGKIGMETGGRLVARDANSRVLGFYDSRKNLTYNSNNHIVAKGDVTSSLVCRNASSGRD